MSLSSRSGGSLPRHARNPHARHGTHATPTQALCTTASPPPSPLSAPTHATIARRVLNCLHRYDGTQRAILVACHEGVIRSITGLKKVDMAQIVPFTLPGT